MYSTCLHCHAPLGANELVEHFPVGRRLAYDAAKGRLWVVCARCRRWNLSPLEERWEAVEECERLARGATARPRAASDHVTLIDLPTGVSLVRIGTPRWKELAFWRYGSRMLLRRRWTNAKHVTSEVVRRVAPYALTTGALGPTIGWPSVIAGFAAITALRMQIAKRLNERVAAHPTGPDGDPAIVRRRHLAAAKLDPAGDAGAWGLLVPSDDAVLRLEGPDALRVAGLALVRQNHAGGARLDVDIAVSWVDEAGSGEAYAASVARSVAKSRAAGPHPLAGTRLEPENSFTGYLWALPDLTRMALEIAVSEESERRALDGELAQLEAAWREAEEVAAIADDLLVPPFVREFLSRHRRPA